MPYRSHPKQRRLLIILAGAMLANISHASAWSMGAVIPKAYVNEAQNHSIPSAVLYALALVESGRTLPSGVYRPWPWTLTIDAKPYYFDNQLDATDKLLEVLAQEEQPGQLGVGLMQVEWRFHSSRFSSANEALNPYHNLKIGAQIFSEYWHETGNLWAAIGRYHSKTQKYAMKYKDRFGDRLVKLLAGSRF